MTLAHSHRINSTMMGIAMSSAIVGGALAPTSIVGITVQTVASEANVPYNAALMFGISIGVNALVVLVAFFMFGGRELIARTRAGAAGRSRPSGDTSPLGGDSGVRAEPGRTLTLDRTETHVEAAPRPKLAPIQMLVITSIFVLVGGFFTLNQLDVDVNLGVVALTIAVVIALVDPGVGRKAIGRIDWSTTLLLGGIITYVAVLTRLGAIDQLGEAARSVSQPLLAAFVICVIAALVVGICFNHRHHRRPDSARGSAADTRRRA